MKITLMAGAAIAVVALAATGAQAGSPDGWYGAIDVGYHDVDLVGAQGEAARRPDTSRTRGDDCGPSC